MKISILIYEKGIRMKIAAEELFLLEEKAAQIRKQICQIANQVGIIHIGGILSAVDVVTALYYKYLDYDIHRLNDETRDKFILSKGHCAILLYTIFCDLGWYRWEDVFLNYNKIGHVFGQHPNRKYNKGIEVSTGSLGHGLSIGVGMALANYSKKIPSRIYCLTGDGEMQEGSNWEAVMYAGSHQLSNLICIVDFNQSTSSFKYGDNIVLNWIQAFEAFGWEACMIDGSNMEEVVSVLESLKKVNFDSPTKPKAIIAKTLKGQNVDFMQGPDWHYGSLDDKLLNDALKSIDRHRSNRREQ